MSGSLAVAHFHMRFTLLEGELVAIPRTPRLQTEIFWEAFCLLLELLQEAANPKTLELRMVFNKLFKIVKIYVHLVLYT